MGLLNNREERASQFISIRTLLVGLAESERCGLADAAGEMLFHLAAGDAGNPKFIRQDQQSLINSSANQKIMDKLLRHVASTGVFTPGWNDEIHESDFDSYGWLRSDMSFFFLIDIGEATDPPFLAASWKPAQNQPEWLKPYENRNRLSISEAVCLLVRTDPEICEPYGINENEGYAEMRRWKAALLDAMNSNKWGFNETTWGTNRDEEQTIEHVGIKAWARNTNAPWPFLDNLPAPAPESAEGRAIASELVASKNRIAELEKILTEVTAARNQSCESTAAFSVNVPHMNKALNAVFKIMDENWRSYDAKRLPKQINIAREIDTALGWGNSGSPNKDPSRNAKVIAMLIKPDGIGDTE